MIKLSKRLQAVADLVEPTNSMIDVGSDHAYIPIYLVQNKQVQFAIASEITQGPLQISQQDIAQANLSGQITTRLGDGLTTLQPNEAIDAAVIAGMGGQLITNILSAGQSQLQHIQQLILEPNNDEFAVRSWLSTHNFQITDEIIVQEGKHVYEIIKAIPGQQELSTQQLVFGPCLLKSKTDVFVKKWQWQLERNQMMLEQLQQASISDSDKIAAVQQRIMQIQEVLQ